MNKQEQIEQAKEDVKIALKAYEEARAYAWKAYKEVAKKLKKLKDEED